MATSLELAQSTSADELQGQRERSALRLQAAARGLNARKTSHREQVLFGVEGQLPTQRACSHYKDELKKYVDTKDTSGSFPQAVQRKPNATGVLFRACNYHEGSPILPCNPGSRATLQGHVGSDNNGSAYISLTVDLQAALYYAGNDDNGSAIVVVLAERCFGIFFQAMMKTFVQRRDGLSSKPIIGRNQMHLMRLISLVSFHRRR